jgi:ATP-dependent exoDNAse (exonuclease V) beta subunit
VSARKKEILARWETNRIDAAAKGTRYHKSREEQTVQLPLFDDGMQEAKITKKHIFDGPFDEPTLFPEALLWDDKLKVAGTADWVLVLGDTVHIRDYKTSGEITKTSFQGETLLHPVTTLLNCNFSTYSLQLSLYAYILERRGYKIGTLAIEHVNRETFEHICNHEVQYLRNEIIALLKHHLGVKTSKST